MDPVDINGNIFFNCDCITGSEAYIASNSIDLIITDPPYGIKGDQLHRHYNRREDLVVEGYVEVPTEVYGDFSSRWIREAERVLKPGGSIFIVSGYTNLFHILSALRSTTLEEVNHIIWKYNFGVFTRKKFVSSHYHILYYEKPGGIRTFNLESRFGLVERDPSNGSLNYQDREDVWVINREYKPGQIKNKNELPTKLLEKMVQYCSNEGDLLCDFFLGGFSTAKVAIGLNRRITGFEISEEMFVTKVEEMKSIVPGYLLPHLRQPRIERVKNQGKPWTKDEYSSLIREYRKMEAKRIPRKEIIEGLCNQFGRGRWSIEKALSRVGPAVSHVPNDRTASDFS